MSCSIACADCQKCPYGCSLVAFHVVLSCRSILVQRIASCGKRYWSSTLHPVESSTIEIGQSVLWRAILKKRLPHIESPVETALNVQQKKERSDIVDCYS